MSAGTSAGTTGPPDIARFDGYRQPGNRYYTYQANFHSTDNLKAVVCLNVDRPGFFRVSLGATEPVRFPLNLVELMGVNPLPQSTFEMIFQPAELVMQENSWHSQWFSFQDRLNGNLVVVETSNKSAVEAREEAKLLLNKPELQLSFRFEVIVPPNKASGLMLCVRCLPAKAVVLNENSRFTGHDVGGMTVETFVVSTTKMPDHCMDIKDFFPCGPVVFSEEPLSHADYRKTVLTDFPNLMIFCRVLANLTLNQCRDYIRDPKFPTGNKHRFDPSHKHSSNLPDDSTFSKSTGSITHESLGIYAGKLNAWTNAGRYTRDIELPKPKPKSIKNPEIPVLKDYSTNPDSDFWSAFPFHKLPLTGEANTPIDVDKFEKEYLDLYNNLDDNQRFNIERTLLNLREGADALVDESKLHPLDDDNSKSVLLPEVARHYTDQLATMIKKGFVAGPFDESPIPNLRINSLFAVNQSDKYRPILNLSKPEGNSFNEAIIPHKLRKVSMSTSRHVAKAISDMGTGAIISKMDHVSAYKLMPVKPSQFYLQGFRWLGKLFIEVRLIFGSISSVPNYDDLHQSFSDLVKTRTGTDPSFLYRCLDDQVVISPCLEDNKRFVDGYLAFAKEINLPLADMTGEDKAFLFRTSGTVLGIYFNTKKMTWAYNESKRLTHMKIIQDTIRMVNVSLKQLQKVGGVVNTLALLCPPLKFLRGPLAEQTLEAEKVDPEPILLRIETVELLHTWLHIFEDFKCGFPIPHFLSSPPVNALAFVSDAAGVPNPDNPPDYAVGVGATGFLYCDDKIRYCGQAVWPYQFILNVDIHQKLFGRKTTLLEAIGLILPLFHNAAHLPGNCVILFVDNLPVVWAYQKGRSKKDQYTSVIVTAINHVATSLGCRVFVRHCPRLSTTPALVADLLSRTDDKGLNIAKKYQSLQYGWPLSLQHWMENPSKDWFLGSKLLADFQDRIKEQTSGLM